ncbi:MULTISPECIES: DUF4124 domain-containing protein [Nitrincola]|uniref:DUF4124 domain-containing protein n=1 Tax=Nitrincola nitratireducens TaxID=1229521 RepID=W9UR99_9GAMM|nr:MULTISPECIES: DUF4124 domain-containing protein [Nitrincola]EXJ09619.1 hypothetical protein D791_03465 [Nitrincola nitratireducens]
MKHFLWMVSASLLSVSLSAQPIYKCVHPDGRLIFSDTQCGDQAEILEQEGSLNSIPSFAQPAEATRSEPTTDSKPEALSISERNQLNNRYTQLSREIDAFFLYSERHELQHLQSVLSHNHQAALAATSVAQDAHAINQRFNNQARDLRTRLWQNKKLMARELIKLEAQRDAALYGLASSKQRRP